MKDGLEIHDLIGAVMWLNLMLIRIRQHDLIGAVMWLNLMLIRTRQHDLNGRRYVIELNVN